MIGGDTFRVIDCESRHIILTSTLGVSQVQYVALSYVWGPAIAGDATATDESHLPDCLPTTIEDAITVTRQLGFLYLWIDRYCIHRDDEDDKHCQIRLMTTIYGAAQFTIIAAAGDGPTYGLPGVSSAHRDSQPQAKVKNHLLTWTLKCPGNLIRNSTWRDRAWTYQEALLSHRRLIFTDEQVYFECNDMICCETMPLCLLEMQPEIQRHCWGAYLRKLFPVDRVGRHSLEIGKRLHEYTAKKLTHKSDILNAFQGILRAFERLRTPVYNHWGVPTFSTLPPELTEGYKRFPTNLAAGFATGLCWTLTEPAKRRHGFPSCSWTGWRGRVKDTSHWWLNVYSRREPNITITLESCEGRIVQWEEFVETLGSGNQALNLSPYIRIHSWTFPVQFDYFPNGIRSRRGSPSGFYAKVDINPNQVVYSYLRLLKQVDTDPEGRKKFQDHSCIGIILGDLDCCGPWWPDQFAMVVDHMGGAWERIGHIDLKNLIFVPSHIGSDTVRWSLHSLPLVRRNIRLA